MLHLTIDYGPWLDDGPWLDEATRHFLLFSIERIKPIYVCVWTHARKRLRGREVGGKDMAADAAVVGPRVDLGCTNLTLYA